MIDFRDPFNRREMFIRYIVWQYRNHDLDTAIPLFKYIIQRQELNINQAYWLMFLFGNCYNAATAYAMYQEMPDIENVDMERLTEWNSTNYKRLPYESDCKWSKGHLDKMTESFLKLLNGVSPDDYFKSLCISDPKTNYEKCRSTLVNGVYKMGRYSVFFTLQAMKECCGLNIEPTSMQYGKDTQSPTDGLAYIMGKEGLSSRIYTNDGTEKTKQAIKYTPDLITRFDTYTDMIINEIHTRFPDVKIDYFTMETALCSAKKLFRRRQGRYCGYYLHRLMENTRRVEKDFPGVDFDIVRDFVKECVPNGHVLVNESIDTSRMQIFLDTGNLPELSQFEDLRNA